MWCQKVYKESNHFLFLRALLQYGVSGDISGDDADDDEKVTPEQFRPVECRVAQEIVAPEPKEQPKAEEAVPPPVQPKAEEAVAPHEVEQYELAEREFLVNVCYGSSYCFFFFSF